jgi:hypothetical protein
MKHYIKSYLWKHSITFDVQLQKNRKVILIVRPHHKDNLVKFLNSKNVLSHVEERLDLVFLHLM